MTSVLILGVLVGMRHAFEPDHVAAMASLTARTTSLRQAVRQGAAWGVGHTITLFIVSGTVMALNTSISAQLADYLEMAVGVMLLVLGFDVIRRLYRERVHFHVHRHDDGTAHFHAHSHKGETPSAHDAANHHHEHAGGVLIRPLLVGLMHGMAGSAALIVLTAQAVQSAWLGLTYVALFGAGSIVGMAALTAVICLPLRSARSLTWAHNGLQAAIGAGTMALGLFTVVTSGGF